MIKFKLEDGAKLPQRGSELAAGLDIHCNGHYGVQPFQRQLIKTGVFLAELPADVYLRVAPRSKLANKLGIDVLAGVIDADYRGEICVILQSYGDEAVYFGTGDAIAQLIPTVYSKADVMEVLEADSTDRGSSGINDTDLRL